MSTLSKISSLSKFNDIKDKELSVFGYFEDIGLSKIGKKINSQFNNVILNASFKGKLNSSLLIYVGDNNSKILLIGLGNSQKYTIDKLRGCAGTAIKAIKKNEISSFVIELIGGYKLNAKKYELTKSLVEGLTLGSYNFNYYKSKNKKEFTIKISILDADKIGIKGLSVPVVQEAFDWDDNFKRKDVLI